MLITAEVSLLCRVIKHHNLHLLKEKIILVRPPITSSRPLYVFDHNAVYRQ